MEVNSGGYLPSHEAARLISTTFTDTEGNNCFSIQMFRERLSYKRRKAYATMSKVIMGNGGFYGCFSEPQGVLAWWKDTAQTHIRSFSFLVAESP